MAFELKFDGAASPNTQSISIPDIVETGAFTLTANITVEDLAGATRVYGQDGAFASYCTISGNNLAIRNDASFTLNVDITGLVVEGASQEFILTRDNFDQISGSIGGTSFTSPSGITGTITVNSLAAVFTSGGAGTSAQMRIRDFDWQGTVSRTYLMNEGTGTNIVDSSGGGNDGTLINPTAADGQWINLAGAGPTITGPDTTTEGSATVAAGTLLDTVTTFSLISGSNSVVQSIDSATATTLNYVARSGVSLCTPSTLVAGLPLAPTISAAGITPYVVQQEADDGVNTPATRNITLNGEATHEVIQAMLATSNVTEGESIFAPSIIDVEDDMQAYVVKAANGMNITWAADGTFTTDADQTETIAVAYFSPSTEQWSCMNLTISQTSITPTPTDGTFGFDFPNFQFPLLFTTAPATLGGYSVGFSDGYEI